MTRIVSSLRWLPIVLGLCVLPSSLPAEPRVRIAITLVLVHHAGEDVRERGDKKHRKGLRRPGLAPEGAAG